MKNASEQVCFVQAFFQVCGGSWIVCAFARGTVVEGMTGKNEIGKENLMVMGEKEREENLTVMEEEGALACSGGLADIIRGYFPGKKLDIRMYSPLTLAYIGDAVYDLIIRTMVVEHANRPANELHRLTIKYVSANAQSKIVQALMNDLTEQEQAVFRRGRNAKPHTTAKNATVADYMRATGFEAVLGYLYLTDNMQRVLELVKKGVELVETKEV